MIQLSSDARLTILLPNTNKALAEAIKNATPSQLETLKEGKSLQSLLTSLFQDKITASKSDQTLIDILKNNPLFKTMGNMDANLKSLLSDLKNSPEFSSKISLFENFSKSLELLNASDLKQRLSESGIFMESKISSIPTLLDESLEHDMKSNLMRLREELTLYNGPKAAELLEHTDKLLMQIDYHQLMSHLNHSTSFYLPFEWDMLEQGSMEIKRGGEEKFYCQINLRLKEYGELDLMMGLYGENQIDIQAHSETKELKELLNDNISLLRSVLIDAGLHPRRVRFLEKNDDIHPFEKTYAASSSENDLGFEVRG